MEKQALKLTLILIGNSLQRIAAGARAMGIYSVLLSVGAIAGSLIAAALDGSSPSMA